MKITHVLFKNQARTRANESMTTALDLSYGIIEAFTHPILGPCVRYEGQPWAIPLSNIAGFAAVDEPKPEAKAKK